MYLSNYPVVKLCSIKRYQKELTRVNTKLCGHVVRPPQLPKSLNRIIRYSEENVLISEDRLGFRRKRDGLLMQL